MWTDAVIGSLRLKQELVPAPFDISGAIAHGNSEVRGAAPLDICTPAAQWAFAVSLPFRVQAIRQPILVRVRASVVQGRIGVGCISRDSRTYVSAEVERRPEDKDEFDILLEPSDEHGCGSLVLRNVADEGRPSHVILYSVRAYEVDRSHLPGLVEVEPTLEAHALPLGTPSRNAQTNGDLLKREAAQPAAEPPVGNRQQVRRFQVLLTHTSRAWDWSKCSRDYLIRRYADAKRLLEIPRFEELPSHRGYQPYQGGLTILDLEVKSEKLKLQARRCIDSRFKIQHAGFVGEKLVLCFEDFLLVLPDSATPVSELDISPGSPFRIDDNWFGGLHTVFPVDDHICLVSSSGSDAVLWVDITRGCVVRRWRLPPELYGVNYALTPEMSVVDHYIHNDIQLGHLNCAYPDGTGGCFISTLIQGDIGHVAPDGKYSLLERGHVGCHGVRRSKNGRDLYFTDSCGGRLMCMPSGRAAAAVHSVDSVWLHDVEEVAPGLYLFCLGDRNEIVFFDLALRRELGRFSFENRGVNVQFVTTRNAGAADSG